MPQCVVELLPAPPPRCPAPALPLPLARTGSAKIPARLQ